jgi:hypothetical protein
MKSHNQNNTFIDRKQFSLSSSRGKPPPEKSSITIILNSKILMPSNPIYTNNLEEDLLEVEASIRYS